MAEVSVGRFPWSEANLLRLELESQGISVVVIGEDRNALTGAIPPAETDVELRVDEKDLERARALIAQVAREKERESAARAAAAPLQRGQSFTWVLAAATVVLSALLYKESRRVTYVDGVVTWSEAGPCVVGSINGKRQTSSCDRDGDGVFEEQETFDTRGRRVSMFFDANQNGSYDKVEDYDSSEKLIARHFDTDDDGRFDKSESYDAKGQRVATLLDSDKNGIFETSEEYDVNGALILRTSDREQDRRFERFELFDRQGLAVTRFVDSDRDGRFDQEDGDAGFLAVSR